MEKENIINLTDDRYPQLLKEIGREAPKQLYYKGIYDEQIFENCLAVVGSRQMTTYGKRVAERIVGELASAGLTIVSGFMYGIDAAAHGAALKVGGKTIAVMPCGIDLIHPAFQKELYNEILENSGLIVSEHEKDFAPAFWTYPRRNRIVAGLARAVLVVEAGEKSGSLITADFARKFGRKIFVVPGPIFSQNSKGIIKLMRQGAEPVDCGKDILRYYRSLSGFFQRFTPEGPYTAEKIQRAHETDDHKPYAAEENRNKDCRSEHGTGSDATQKIHCSGDYNSQADEKAGQKDYSAEIERKIMEQLQREPMGVDELVVCLGVSASKLGAIVSLMELKSLIEQDGGKYYVG